MLTPAEYTRRSRSHELRDWYGKRGKVYAVATVLAAPAGFEWLVPYDEVIVKFPDGNKRTFMAMYGEGKYGGKFEINDEVECAVGANSSSDEGLISYVIKVRHPIKKLSISTQ